MQLQPTLVALKFLQATITKFVFIFVEVKDQIELLVVRREKGRLRILAVQRGENR